MTEAAKDYRSLMQSALLELRQMRAQLQSTEAAQTEAIAVIGIGCRFPGGVASPASFWQLLSNGVDAITEVPLDRWDLSQYYDPTPAAPGKIYSRYGGFVEHLQTFDAPFFGISHREALSLDPQQRLLLEVTWEALEHAGIVPEADSKTGCKTGVFVGMSSNDYSQQLLLGDRHNIDAYLATGNSHSTAAGRISYTFGFTGASLAVDTACSSSLVAVHLACQNLRSQDCYLSIVGGVNRIISPEFSINFSKAKMLAADGRCKSFDARADGFGRAEGCGVVVLKRASDAMRDGDRILALIRGSAVNQDGRSSGLTVPNGLAQQQVIQQALQNSRLEPSQIDYIEAHGTGTALGDPIEANALGAVFARSHSAAHPLRIGSVKTNIGHLEAAAGIAGLIKVVLSLQHREIPAHLHFQQPTPHIPWSDLPLRVMQQRESLAKIEPIRAGVSSFGFSGTNAHIILEEAQPILVPVQSALEDIHVLALSAKSPEALRDLAQKYQQFLSTEPSFSDVCFSARTGRMLFPYQFHIAAHSSAEAIAQLTEFLSQPEVELTQVDSTENLKDETRSNQTHYQKIALPTYPFQRQRYWVDRVYSNDPPRQKKASHSLLGSKLLLSRSPSIYFENQITQNHPAFLSDHRVFGQIILPMSGYIEMALAAKTEYSIVEQLKIHQAIGLSASPKTIQLVLAPSGSFEILTQTNQDWTLQASGYIKPLESTTNQYVDREQLRSTCDRPLDIAAYYEQFREHGIDYGDRFQVLTQLWQGDRQALGLIQNPPSSEYRLHPVLLDGAFQVIGAALNPDANETYLPISLERLELYRSPGEKIWCHAQLSENPTYGYTAHLTLFTDDGAVVALISGLQIQKTSLERSPSFQDWLYKIHWQPQQLRSSLDFFPLPSEVSDRFLPWFTSRLAEPGLAKYQALLPQLENLSFSYILNAFTILGWQPLLHEQYKAIDLAQKWNIPAPRHALFNRLLEILSEEKILHRQADQWQVNQLPPSVDPLALHDTLQAQHPEAAIELALLHRCGSQLAAVLKGDIDPIQLLFPNGDLTLLTQLYQDSSGAVLMNQNIQQVLEFLMQHRSRVEDASSNDRPLRILEIGAGTGGTTAHLLPHLKSVQYCFTDVSPIFLHQAQQRFQDYSFIQYQTFDIEQSPASQNLPLHQYDIVLAANVIHATVDLQKSFQNIHQLLASGGTLILLEGVCPVRWLDLIFGITEGWWRFQDSHLRPHYPLLPVQQWQQVLQLSGFTAVAVSPDEQTALQTIFVARAERQLSPKSYIIFCDRQGIGSHLAQLLSDRGHSALQVFPGETYQQHTPQSFTLSPTSPDDLQKLLDTQSSDLHIIHLWSLDLPTADQLDCPLEAMQPNCISILNLVQSKTLFPLWLVTQGAIAANGETLPGIAQTSTWGLGTVTALERPEQRYKCIDLDINLPIETQAQLLLLEIESETTETQVLLREKDRFVSRLTSYSDLTSEQITLPSQPFQLRTTGNTLEDLTLQPCERRSPQPHEVEIRVWATGLNFIDVLDSLRLLPFERDGFGVECAGEVVAIGSAVTHLQIGDAVVALASQSFSQYVTTHGAVVVALPSNLSYESAATIPANFLTADYALRHLARLSAGEKVLIHAAAGGTGLAAVQIAQQIGAEVFATASPGKWQALRALGVQHIFNSRTLDFAEQIQHITAGQGVDVVLNSLSGEFISKSLSVLSSPGRFLEIGKRDIWSSDQVQQTYPQVNYHLIDLRSLAHQQPDLIQAILKDLMTQFAAGKLKPLPRSRFPMSQVIPAFRHMQQAKHIGKVVLSQTSSIQPHSTYLITGGLGGLGLRVATWLRHRGATHVVLFSRNSLTALVQPQLEALEQQGLQITLVQGDVSDRDQLAQCLKQIEQTLPPLRGIFHGAGVLDDGLIQDMNWQRLQTVMAPKVSGAWHLHTLTQRYDLDWFVLFSSAASLLGSPGQANHVAANLFLDGLAHHRRAIALPALSINWGVWSEIGSAVDQVEPMRARGVEAIAPDQGIQILEQLLQHPVPQVGVIPINWSVFRQRNASSTNPFLEYFQTDIPTVPIVPSPILQELETTGDRLTHLTHYLQTEVGKVLGLPPAQSPKPQQGFFDLGMDSLMSVELKNRLESNLAITLPATVIFEYPTIQALAQHIINDHLHRLTDPPPDSPPPDDPIESAILAELTELETLLSRN
jgi:acyl transferase domain-containing protein/NADPH:quinone reductase-like Zn-dependent oxidoreductase/SAM-dependent methyltransferase/acyl carrier protein